MTLGRGMIMKGAITHNVQQNINNTILYTYMS